MGVNERLADASHAFVTALHTMHDELLELAKTNEKSRKSLKETCMRHEKAVIEAEQNAEKAKNTYNKLCEEMERMKDPNKTKFFKSKNTPQHEQELAAKISTAESEYRQRVNSVQRLRKELMSSLRPQNIKQLKDHILECDSGISLQLQKYATLNETLALNSGFVVCPLKPVGSTTSPLSIKEIASKVDNELDFYNDILKIPNKKKQLNRPEVTFVQHPYMSTASTFVGTSSNVGTTKTTTNSVGTNSQWNTISSPPTNKTNTFNSSTTPNRNSMLLGSGPGGAGAGARAGVGAGVGAGIGAGIGAGVGAAAVAATSVNAASPAVAAPTPGYPISQPSSQHNLPYYHDDVASSPVSHQRVQSPIPVAGTPLDQPQSPPLPEVGSRYTLPTFGTPLDTLIEYEALPDSVPVPRVITQCVTAIDRFGTEVEGIYRHAGNPSQVQTLKRMFDTDPASVDLSQPARYGINDIHAVSSTLKLYFQSLPDPLLTHEFAGEFLEAARIDNDWKRRDAVHEVVNKLPESNYIVLRYLIFHLDRVQKCEAVNRMGIIHLGNIWGSVLMGEGVDGAGGFGGVGGGISGPGVNEMALMARVVETILYNCEHIFEADDLLSPVE